ncbi:MAG: UbiA family prenyltransferase [Planctomycetes bacterium]|nr:UbiA family prenyltransferase [Planctomycetota bacterium]
MQRLVTILRFVRFPLVWTALADVLAGAAVAAGSPAAFAQADLLPLLLISPGLYLFGMGLNDLLDRREDAAAGADRPLVRGELSITAAVVTVVFLLGLVAIGTSLVRGAPVTMVAFTFAAVCLYDSRAKRHTVTAVPFMAACRVGNILIGWATVTGSWRFWDSSQATVGWAIVIAIATLTALASLVSALEKRHGLRSVAGLRPSRVILTLLLLLPVVDGVCVAWSWSASPWAALWATGVPLCMLTATTLRRARTPVASP